MCIVCADLVYRLCFTTFDIFICHIVLEADYNIVHSVTCTVSTGCILLTVGCVVLAIKNFALGFTVFTAVKKLDDIKNR